MIFSLSKKINSGVSTFLLLILIVSTFVLAPISPTTGKPQEAHAIGVVVLGGNGTVQDTLSAASNAASAAIADAFFIKEFTLDGIASGLAKMVLKSMTQSILTWINSGFEGSPAFVTDLQQFMVDRADAAAGDFIYNDPDLNFLCSPFQLDVKVALAVNYQKSAHGGLDAQCTLSNVTDNVEGFLNGSFSEGGWASWFEVTQNTNNTPTGAYLAAEAEMYARIIDDRGNTIRELDWGQGFLSFKVCSDTQSSSGAQQNCNISTPGSVIAEQINKSLGAGQDELIEADEINEIIGALFSQLAKQAITGINGLLGLGGSSYSDSSFGERGDQSFLDALGEEGTLADSIRDPFEQAIKREQEQVALQNIIISRINAVEAQMQVHGGSFGSCFVLTLSDELKKKREDAILQIVLANANITTLRQMQTSYTETKNPEFKISLVQQLLNMGTDGTLIDIKANATLEFYIKVEFAEKIKEVQNQISRMKNRCDKDD